jgi:CcdB protein
MVMQYDVFRIRNGAKSGNVAYLIVLQSDALRDITTAIVAPVSKVAANSVLKKVNIPILVEGETFHIMMPEMGAFSVKQLGMFVTNFQSVHEDVMLAIDLMFAGI